MALSDTVLDSAPMTDKPTADRAVQAPREASRLTAILSKDAGAY